MAPVLLAFLAAGSAGCGGCGGDDGAGGADADGCSGRCGAGEVCRYDVCVPTPAPCTVDGDCAGDTYCDEAAGECLPFGVGPVGDADPTCVRDPVPGVFFPGAQCEWLGPPVGDPYPDHRNVLGAPAVALLDRGEEFSRPSIVFISYNFTDGGEQSCVGTDPAYYGVLRIIDGRTCEQTVSLALPPLLGSASVAIADLGGADDRPEIVAAKQNGGLVAFTFEVATGWRVLWETASTIGDALCNWGGPSIHDLDDDGVPEIIFYATVFDAAGVVIDESIPPGAVQQTLPGVIPVVADVDADGTPELVTGTQLYGWDRANRRWAPEAALPGGGGLVAVADFGTFGADSAGDDRATLDGVAEVVTSGNGQVMVFTVGGRLLMSAPMQGPTPGRGGPPTIADVDGDGRVELASAGGSAYTVYDLDCAGTLVTPATCPSGRTDFIAWTQPSQDLSSNLTGSSVFDFDGDRRAEVVYGDECFTRVYDGVTGDVLYSRYRTSCTWYENPVIADVDGDFNAEIVSTSNSNCPGSVSCPALDPIFDGVRCLDDDDCPGASTCGREQPADALGRCRCSSDTDCGGDSAVCRDPIAGPSPAGQVCRAGHPGSATAFGVRVLSDQLDRWVNTRTIWNQHAYSVTNIDDRARVPRTSAWLRNWAQPGLNNFRLNAPGDASDQALAPDLTVHAASATCVGADATVTAEVCNRGTEPVADGVLVSVYAGVPPALVCAASTVTNLYPGGCQTVSCVWPAAAGDAQVVVDDDGTGQAAGDNLECREGNNSASVVGVACP